MERMHSDRNAGIFLTSIGTKIQSKIVMQQPLKGIDSPYLYKGDLCPFVPPRDRETSVYFFRG